MKISSEERDAGLSVFGYVVMDTMRRVSGVNPVKPDLQAIYGIGGHIDLAVVNCAGTKVETVHVWPDVVGEKIDPFSNIVAEAA